MLIVVLKNGASSFFEVHEWFSQKMFHLDKCHPLTSSNEGISMPFM
jgi:hypothetical protein